eukprot:COSAG06_NODE_563_length_14268_cov_25.500670_5_plen_278_part_00
MHKLTGILGPPAAADAMGNVAGRQQPAHGSQQQQAPPLAPASPEAQETYRGAFVACAPTLDVVGQASSSMELEAACGWWRVCMARALPQCRDALAGWKVAAAETVGTSSLQAEHMAAVTAIAPWAALASCVEQHAGAAGVASARTLQHVATESGVGQRIRVAAQREWVSAARDCEPMRQGMQKNLLGKPDTNLRDEVLLMQVWMFGIASRLQRCSEQAENFAQVRTEDHYIVLHKLLSVLCTPCCESGTIHLPRSWLTTARVMHASEWPPHRTRHDA